MSAREALKWHEIQFRKHWTEPRVEPLEMTGDEIVEFLTEYCPFYQHVMATKDTPAIFILECEEVGTVRAGTLREAVCLAAAKLKELNQ